MAKQWNARDDTPDLHGKVAVVTGASGGIGLQIVGLLARRGAKAQKAKEAILTEFKDVEANKIDFVALDMTILKSIEVAARALISKEKKLDILSMHPPSFRIPWCAHGLLTNISSQQCGYLNQFHRVN
ncbi:hypothetical protein QQX98_012092 [Neonectria punicea]|uniref:Uncharacterized protein n=1 Tax=Neonectria punicea TaxID=979145 RepID=A0ABR1GK49_9HYPO